MLITSIVRDISDRIEMEREKRKASDFARSLIEASLDALVTINQEGKITLANSAIEKGISIHE